eukprot:CAMPEP_0204164290 /NCGR_PEP_ID=MMETSP0361-20130328/37162_1 /ASSEMBLY_ACC=CAM_ASM_000343 /TAXON_ID=268821 /ORGANISM="Scrippsiella Hangoei, Strain SHTV-5" /LENGTH=108 /DNA_ID=CAMNT_0051121129 /DNA_START=298 /DNA_END=622 /DNA_ORIENTATION=-
MAVGSTDADLILDRQGAPGGAQSSFSPSMQRCVENGWFDGINSLWRGREFSVKMDWVQRFGTVDMQATTKESAGQEQDTQANVNALVLPPADAVGMPLDGAPVALYIA